MINMAHCRFRNTLDALRECSNYLDENSLLDLSKVELDAAKALIALCNWFSQNIDTNQ